MRPPGAWIIVIRRAALGSGATSHERARVERRHSQESKVAYIITEPCIGTKDASCVEVCPVDCIYEGGDQYYIHPDDCIDCGAC